MRASLQQRSAALLLSAAFAVVLLPSAARAQGDLKNTPTPPTPREAPRSPGPRVIIRTTYVKATSVTVVAEPNAFVTLTPLKRPANSKAETVSPDKKTVTFYDLPPGTYLVRAELDGHRPDEETFTVTPHRAHDVELRLPVITYDVTLTVNVESGRVMYGKAGGERVVADIKSGVAVLPGLEPGSYAVRVEAEGDAYEPLDTSIKVTPQNTKIPLTLKHIVTTREFAGRSTGDWRLPDSWRVDSLKLTVAGRGLALPSNEDFHHYKDFQLSTNARMVNGVAVSLALRVRDPKSYYLIQLTGPNAEERYVVRGFIVKDGAEQPLGGASPIGHLAETIKPGKDFHLLLTMKGNVISISVEDSETGETLPVGVLSDSSNTFRIGAVGVAARGSEQFELESFTVCTPICEKR